MYTFQTEDDYRFCQSYMKSESFSGKYTYGLSNAGVADGAFRLASLTDTIGTVHTKEVVPTGDQCCNDLAFKAH